MLLKNDNVKQLLYAQSLSDLQVKRIRLGKNGKPQNIPQANIVL